VFGPVTTLQNVAVISSMQITPVTGGDVGEGPFWPDDCCPVEFCNCDCPAALSDWTLDGLLCAAAGDTATTSVVISTNCFNFAIVFAAVEISTAPETPDKQKSSTAMFHGPCRRPFGRYHTSDLISQVIFCHIICRGEARGRGAMGGLCRGLTTAFSFVLLAGAASSACACDADTIDSIADDGSIIVMNSGASFRVNPLDQTDAMFWLSEDDVLICEDETVIVNKNDKRGRVRVSRIR